MDNNFLLKGKIIKISDVLEIKNNFRKREILLLTEDRVPQKLTIEFHNNRTKLFNMKFFENSTVEIEASIRSSESNGKYFTRLIGNKIEFKNQESVLSILVNQMPIGGIIQLKNCDKHMTISSDFLNKTFEVDSKEVERAFSQVRLL